MWHLEARWQQIIAEGRLTAKSISELEKASATERVIAVRLHGIEALALSSQEQRRSGPADAVVGITRAQGGARTPDSIGW